MWTTRRSSFPIPAARPKSSCQHAEMRRILRSDMEKLSAGCRRAVQLCIFEEATAAGRCPGDAGERGGHQGAHLYGEAAAARSDAGRESGRAN